MPKKTRSPAKSADPVQRADDLLASLPALVPRVLARAALLRRARVRSALRADDAAAAEVEEARRKGVLVREERARVPPVAAAPEAAVLHGRVVDEDGLGRAGLWVVVKDRRGRDAARVETTELGYYRFVFPADAKGAEAAEVQLEVRAERDGQPIGRAADALPLRRGRVTYAEVRAAAARRT